MTVRQALRAAQAALTAAGVPDPAVDAALLLSHVTGEHPLKLRALGDQALPDARFLAFDALLSRRLRREPLQYITGEAPFMGLTLHAAPGALIPRADTEILCVSALDRLPKGGQALDLCTGSGAVAVAIKRLRPDAAVTACDISAQALAVARQNAAANAVDIALVQGDLFAPLAGQAFDVIACNPPYIPTDALPSLQPEVLFEPAVALDGGPDGLAFYRRIAALAPAFLREGGWLLLEIGCDQGDAVRALLSPGFADIAVQCDMRGLCRVVSAAKPPS